jgi:signal transduction histidine kinase
MSDHHECASIGYHAPMEPSRTTPVSTTVEPVIEALAPKAGAWRFPRTWAILTVSIVLVVIMALYLSRSLATLSGGATWVSHNESVRFELTQVLQNLSDLGSGVASYALTHDESRFEAARAADTQIAGRVAALQRLVADNPAQSVLAARLADLAQQRQSQTREQRERALRGDVAGVQNEIGTGSAKRLMDAARGVVAQMQTDEGELLRYHTYATQSARKAVAVGIWTTASLAIVLLIAVAVVTRRDAQRLRRVEDELAATERAARRALIESGAALRAADQRKDVFLATLSHELRNPLAPIRTATRVLETPHLPAADLERSRAIISRQVRHMASLLDDLLDISRITRGALALKYDTVELRAIVEAAIETAQPQIAAHGHRLEIAWPEDSIVVRADPVRLTQVVANLLTNAAKYTPSGGHISLATRIEPQHILIVVRDDGIGIVAEMLPKVFEMFAQGPSGADRSDGGLGIGLALVKAFVELHGGRVEARSVGTDHGSEFVVMLPATMIERVEKPVPDQPNTAGAPEARRSVLVADDNRDGADIMAMLLDQAGFGVHVAYSGADALAAAEEQRPFAAILDIGMPVMNGYEVARRIRTQPWGERMKLIAVTGWGQDDDKRKALDAGFDHHLTKPIDPSALERLLSTG